MSVEVRGRPEYARAGMSPQNEGGKERDVSSEGLCRPDSNHF